jgi:FkbH-like protein
MVFLDDDPTNRALVRSLVPEVEVPELPKDPKEYVRFLHGLPYFQTAIITDEDKMRGNLYVTERLRKEAEKQHLSKEEFLKSLSLELSIFKDDATCLARLSQLTEKTNQFNTLKVPLSEEEIAKYIKSNDHSVYYARLQDMFGDYGVILFALIEKKNDIWNIKSLLMSCRVFGRGVEDAFLGALISDAIKEGVQTMTIASETTEKNMPALEFIEKYFTEGYHSLPSSIISPEWVTIHI